MGYRIPSFGYPGGKTTIRQWMVNRMPVSGRKYVEPFAGRGNVFWLAAHMLDFRQWQLNDPWTARWFDAIQKVRMADIPDELSWIMARVCNNRSQTHRDTDDVSVALESRVSFSGGVRGRGSGLAGMSAMWRVHPSLKGFKKTLILARNILKTVRPQITGVDWNDCGLEKLSECDFVYLDPPYENADKYIYHHDTADHDQLLNYLVNAPHLWMLSGFRSRLYTGKLGRPYDRRLLTKHMQHHTKPGRLPKVVECIWTNYTIESDGSIVRKVMKRARIRKRRLKA
jgi:site-specific DNA-adenine methylase